MGERLRAIWERLKADFHKNPALWIGIGISAAILVIAWLAYRKSTGLSVPAAGYGFPGYGGASGGGDGGGGGLGYQPYQPPSAPDQPITNPFLPISGGSNPFPIFPPFGFGPNPTSGPAAASGQEDQANFGFGGYQVQGSVQNPSAQQDAQHQGIVIPSYPVQNPLAPAQQAHTGSQPVLPVMPNNPLAPSQQQHTGGTPPPPPTPNNPTAPSQQQHKGSPPPKKQQPPPPPPTLQPTNSGHGRAI